MNTNETILERPDPNVAIRYAALTLAIVHLRALEDETDNPRLAREAGHERLTLEAGRRMLMQPRS